MQASSSYHNINQQQNPKNMKKTISILLLIFTVAAFSQANRSNELTAEGIAKTKVKPDLASFRITVTKHNAIEKTAIKDLNLEIGKLQNVLLKLGFTDKNIKISEYKVSKNDYNNSNEVMATNTLAVNFLLDNKRIEGFYQEIQNESLQDLDIDFETQISEDLEKKTRQKLVKTAIENAKENAENIANALEVKLFAVKEVSKYNQRDFQTQRIAGEAIKTVLLPMKSKEVINPVSSFDKFEVQEVELEETITIVYEIVKK